MSQCAEGSVSAAEDRQGGCLVERALRVYIPVLLGITIVARASLRAVSETDLGWHLAVGDLLRRQGMFYRNALSWTAPDHPWYPTSWLFDYLLSALVIRHGLLGVQLWIAGALACALAAAAWACLHFDRLGAWLIPGAALLLQSRVSPRPHVVSWALLAIVLGLCLRGSRRGVAFRLACVPLIALGSNLHAGAAFSSAILGIFSVDAALRVGSRARSELAVAAAGFGALLVNPGFLFNVRYLFDHLHVQDVVRLQEFMRPTLRNSLPFFVLLPAAIYLFLRASRDQRALLIAVLLFALFGLYAIRLTYKFYIVALPCLSYVQSMTRTRWRAGPAAIASALALLSLLGEFLSQSRGSSSEISTPNSRLASEFNEHLLPVRAAEFARTERLSGPLFNSFSDGGYLAWALPGVPVFQDGRVQAYPPSHFEALQKAERDKTSFLMYLQSMGVEWAITLRIRERLGGFRLLNDPGWALVYWDELSEVRLRRDLPRFSERIERLEYRFFQPYGSIIGAVERTPAADLPHFEEEVGRYRRTSPDDTLAAIVDCALAVRGIRADAEERCARAEASATTGSLRTLLAKARSLSPVHP